MIFHILLFCMLLYGQYGIPLDYYQADALSAKIF